MKKLTKSVLAVVLSASFSVTYAQKAKVDTAGTKDIEGVVVTALGVKREKKSLGYASQEVKGAALTEGTTKTGNVTSLLSGKVAGLQVNSNTNFGGTSNIVIRGYKSLSGGTPLVVIDGSPISNNNGNNNGVYDYGNGEPSITTNGVPPESDLYPLITTLEVPPKLVLLFTCKPATLPDNNDVTLPVLVVPSVRAAPFTS
jgi:hypothetical protein